MQPVLKGILISAMGVVIALPVSAQMNNELNNEVQLFCDKMKQCTSGQLEGLSADNEMKKMVEDVLEKSCQAMISDFNAMPPSPQLEKAAVACLQSMNAQNCSDLQKENETPECQELNKLVQ